MQFIIEHLSKSFGKKEVLRDMGFTFEAGKIYGLLGRNGAGKTTFFNCINRDLRADGGSFLWRRTARPGHCTRRRSATSSPRPRCRSF